MLIFYEISKGLLDQDTEIEGTDVGTEESQDLNKRTKSKTAFGQHKTMSMSAYFGGSNENKEPAANKQLKDSKADKMSNYINRTTNLIQKEDNKKYINFAYDLPNLHFLSIKWFLMEMAKCFENPMFVNPFIKWLKDETETF